MFSVFRRAYRILPGPSRRQLLAFQFVILLGALVEVLGVASIVPFMALVMKPELIETNHWIHMAYATFGFQSHRAFLIFTGVAFVGLIVVNNALAAYSSWSAATFTRRQSVELGVVLLECYLRRPWIWFLSQTTAKLGSKVLTEVSQYVNGFLGPLVRSVAKLLSSVFLIAILTLVDPIVTLVCMGILGGTYFLIYSQVRPLLARLGKQRVRWNRVNFLVANDALTGVQEIKLYQCEHHVSRRFEEASGRLASILTKAFVLGELPRFLMETLVFSGLVGIVLYLIATREDASQLIPTLSLYAIAGYRLLPALTVLFKNLATLRFNYAVVDTLYEDMYAGPCPAQVERKPFERGEPMGLKERLELRDVSFSYPQGNSPTIRNLSLSIERRTCVGFVGGTGAGKTTLMNILLGFLQPSSGEILVDGTPVGEHNVRSWHRTVGYVPQALYLSNASIRENIALGLPLEAIDEERVLRAARLAQIHDFIQDELPQGYDTVVGDRGLRLSGGQRQRIVIARALYHDPEVIILDEATSALDGITEQMVMEAIGMLSREKTVIIIAHRLTTVKNCDTIYVLADGAIVDRGTYDELMASNHEFRAMALALSAANA